MAQAVSPFILDEFVEDPPYCEDEGVTYARARIAKTFSGDLVGTSTVEMLSTRVDSGGAGYVALERVVATLGGKSGSFAIAHIGTMSAGEYFGKWPIVPGSGTGELLGISGEARIEISSDGAHTLYIDYEIAVPG